MTFRMKKVALTFSSGIVFFLLIVFSARGQDTKPRIAVIGSSTAYGQFNGEYPRDSGYVFKLEKYYKDLGLISGIDNYARSGADCYDGMPSDYVPPEGRPVSSPTRNITYAINHVPKPSVVLVNYPSNHYDDYSDEEIIFCLTTIKNYANDHGVKCYITTTQPRNKMLKPIGDDGLCRMLHLRNLIMETFGEYAIDFYTDIADAGCQIITDYSLGDGVHLNPAGHTVLRDIMIEKNILLGIVALDFVGFRAVRDNENVRLNWQIYSDSHVDHFSIKRSEDGIIFKEIGRITGGNTNYYQFVDKPGSSGKYFYKIEGVESTGKIYYSRVVSVNFGHNIFSIGKILQTRNLLRVEIFNAPKSFGRIQIVNMNGQVLLNEYSSLLQGVFEKNISTLPSGTYALIVNCGNGRIQSMFFKE